MGQCGNEERQERRRGASDPDAGSNPTASLGEHPRDRPGAHARGGRRYKARNQSETDNEERSESDSTPHAKTLSAFRHRCAFLAKRCQDRMWPESSLSAAR
jgi:hypothetical protein